MRWIVKLQSCERVNSFTILELQEQEIGEFYLVQERRAVDCEGSKL